MADNGVPEWGASLRALVGAQGATLVAIQGTLKDLKKTLDDHCLKLNGNAWKKWAALGFGLGVGLTGTGTALAKFLGL